MVKCDRYDGVSGRKVLKCITWIGTAVLWTVSGGVPHSLGIMGESAAAEANGLTFLQISDKSLGSVEVHQVWSLSSAQPLVARMAVRTAKQQELALRGTMTNNVHACRAAVPRRPLHVGALSHCPMSLITECYLLRAVRQFNSYRGSHETLAAPLTSARAANPAGSTSYATKQSVRRSRHTSRQS
jgi:hypothetical protein